MIMDRRRVSKGTLSPPRFVTRHIAGETLIVPICGGVGELEAIYTLNEVGSRIWQLMDASTTVNRLAQTVSDEYDVAPEQATKDVIEFLDVLEARGLIERSAVSGQLSATNE